MANTIHKGDIKHIFRIWVKDDGSARNISTATVLKILLENSIAGTITAYDAELTNSGADGGFEYETEDADVLDWAGPGRIQGHVTLAGGQDFHTKKGGFEVESILVAT